MMIFINSSITLFERNGEDLIDWILLDGDAVFGELKILMK